MKQTIDWKGDGRVMVCPPEGAPGVNPSPVRLASARKLAEDLNRSGRITHSGQGSMLWVSIDWCIANNKAFDIESAYGPDGHCRGTTLTINETWCL